MAMIYEKNKVYMVPLADIQDDPRQPRKYLDPVGMEEMTASVKQVGIIQPVICRQDPATYLVYNVAGRRRCAAARLAGLTEIPCLFIDGNNSDEIAVLENIQRQDLNPVEEAEAFQLLMESHAYGQEQLAAVMGKDRSTISRSVSINRLPKEIRDICRQDLTIPKTVLCDIAQKKQERSMLTAFRKYRDHQAKIAVKESAASAAPTQRKRTPFEVLIQSIDDMATTVGDLEFPNYPAEDRAKLIEVMTSARDTLDEAITRAVKNKKKPM